MQFRPSEFVANWYNQIPVASSINIFSYDCTEDHQQISSTLKIEAILPLSKRIVSWCENQFRVELLFWVREYGIWPSSENLHLYYLWRRSLGDFHTIEDKPVHLSLAHEREDMISLVYMSILFGWGFTVASSHRDRSLNVDHDGAIWVLSESPSDRSSLQAILR